MPATTPDDPTHEEFASERARLAEISRIVSSTQNLDDVFSSFADQVRELVHFDRMVISELSIDRNSVRDRFVDGAAIAETPVGTSFTVGIDELYVEVFENNRHFHVFGSEYLDYVARNKIEEIRSTVGFRSFLTVPFIWRGASSGFMTVRSFDARGWSEHEIDLAWQVSTLLAAAIAFSNQFAEIENESQQRDHIAKIGRIVSSSPNLQEVFAAFYEEALQLIPVDRLAIDLIDHRTGLGRTAYAGGLQVQPRDTDKAYYSLDTGRLPSEVYEEHRSFVANKDALARIAKNDDSNSNTDRIEAGLVSALFIPIVQQGVLAGSITFRSKLADPYTERHAELGEQIASQIAGVIASNSQLARIEQESAERQMLASVALRASQTTDLNELFDGLADDIAEIVSYARLAITRNDWEQSEKTVVFIRGKSEGNWELDVQNPVNNLAQGNESDQEFRTRVWKDAFHLESAPEEDPDWPEKYRKGRFDPDSDEYTHTSWVEVPIGIPNEIPTAFLAMRAPGVDKFSQNDQDLLSQIAIQIAPAIENANAARLLAESEANYRELVENSHTIIWQMDAKGRYTYVNDAVNESLEYSPDEMIGVRFLEFQDPALRDDDMPFLSSLAGTTQTVTGDVEFLSKSGSRVILAFSATPITEDGIHAGVRGTARDVTTERIAQAETRIRTAALEEASDAVVVMSPDTTIEYVNSAFLLDTGFSRDEVIGESSKMLRADGVPTDKYDDVWDVVMQGKSWRGTNLAQRKDGSKFTIDATVSPVFDEDGTISSFVSIRRDITDRLQAEQDRQARNELDAQNRQLQRITEQRDEFFSSVSHELRTPLTSIVAFADILNRNTSENLSKKQLDQLEVIRRNGRGLSHLVEDMLDITRLNNKNLRIDIVPLEIDEIVGSVIASLAPTANERSQQFVIESDTQDVWLNADADRLTQILSNLVVNACKYSPSGTTINISTVSEEGCLIVEVSDEGYGMSEEELELLFSPFARSSRKEIQRETGTGLGMSITKTLVELHGGSIVATSAINVGSVVSVSLPGVMEKP
jgi:PAS domain S-box-containing protein